MKPKRVTVRDGVLEAIGRTRISHTVRLCDVNHIDWFVRPFSGDTLILTFWTEDPRLGGSRYSAIQPRCNTRADYLGGVSEFDLFDTVAHESLTAHFLGRHGVTSTIALSTLQPHPFVGFTPHAMRTQRNAP